MEEKTNLSNVLSVEMDMCGALLLFTDRTIPGQTKRIFMTIDELENLIKFAKEIGFLQEE